jgi:ABC-type metal ion transport system substrate-binding protein
LVAREDNKDSEAMKILIEALQSEKVENFILNKI